MGLKDFFKKKQPSDLKITDLTLSDLKMGYMVDYDLKTWQVTAHNTYDWGDGDLTLEWQLKSHDDTIYLELESDDEEQWSISRKIPVGQLGGNVTDHIMTHDDPPDQINYQGVTYYLDESGGGHFLSGGKGPGKELLKWEFTHEDEMQFVTIEQWSERDFEASAGTPVEAYQFTDILPSAE